jgi:hypothetical protein
MISPPADAFTSTIPPPSNRTSRSETRAPAAISGAVDRTWPSVRRQSGVVKISSVGMLGMCSIPAAVVKVAHCQRDSGISPTVRSVPGPRKRIASKPRLVSFAARASSWSA